MCWWSADGNWFHQEKIRVCRNHLFHQVYFSHHYWLEVLSSEQLTSQPRSRCPRSWRSCPSRWSTRSFHFHQTQPRANFSWKFSAFSWAHFRHCCSWREFNISIMNCMVPSFDWKGTNWSGSTFDKSVMIFSCPYLMSSHLKQRFAFLFNLTRHLNIERSPAIVPRATTSSSGWKLRSLMLSWEVKVD